MVLKQIIVNTFLFIIAFFGVTLNYKNILLTLMGIELMLLCISLNFIMFSIYLNDAYGQVFSMFILTVAASESAVGLAILIVSYKVRNTIEIAESNNNK